MWEESEGSDSCQTCKERACKLCEHCNASRAVQKANYAVKMYKNVGFEIVDESAEEYIMVCLL